MLDSNQKKEINALLKSKQIIAKKEVFDMIARSASYEDVTQFIEEIYQRQIMSRKPLLNMAENIPNYNIFGKDIISNNAIEDMNFVMRLPGVIGGALLPDAHRVMENHVPVGGVIVTDELIYPSIVGSDIACSVFLTTTLKIVDDDWFQAIMPTLKYVLTHYTYFGQEINPENVVKDQNFFKNPPSMDSSLGRETLAIIIDSMRYQFGTSGDGNHFVEFGITENNKEKRLSILSHFGSRSIGQIIAKRFEEFARDQYEMPKNTSEAPLDLTTPEGMDYFELMNFAGQFAEYGHKWLHSQLLEQLSIRIKENLAVKNDIYSKHNFSWLTSHGLVHRKGATPAEYGELGVIPATMGDITQIVRGMGNLSSFNSASHGAGRTHSRGQALQAFKGDTAEFLLKNYDVHLIGGGPDEDPRAYKKIESVMKSQIECVEPIGKFYPKVVRMAYPRFLR